MLEGAAKQSGPMTKVVSPEIEVTVSQSSRNVVCLTCSKVAGRFADQASSRMDSPSTMTWDPAYRGWSQTPASGLSRLIGWLQTSPPAPLRLTCSLTR